MGDTRYLFDNRWDQARRRLALLEELYDPLSIRRLEALGVAAGWRCLEIGAGAGSITRWMSHRVGPSGRVVATDVQTCLLDDLQGDTVEVWCHDVVTEPLPRESFDLVHTRGVLGHLAAREQVLDSLVSAVRPGGWLLVEEGDLAVIQASGGTAYAIALQALERALTEAGGDSNLGGKLPLLLQARGLVGVGAEAVAPMFSGGSSGAQLMEITFTQMAEQSCFPEDELAATRLELGDSYRWFMNGALVGAWGQKP